MAEGPTRKPESPAFGPLIKLETKGAWVPTSIDRRIKGKGQDAMTGEPVFLPTKKFSLMKRGHPNSTGGMEFNSRRRGHRHFKPSNMSVTV